VDLVRSTVYILLPLSILLTILLVSQGVIQNLDSYRPVAGSQELVPMGPAASQIAIKQPATNGGGFFNVNAAHPFENRLSTSAFIWPSSAASWNPTRPGPATSLPKRELIIGWCRSKHWRTFRPPADWRGLGPHPQAGRICLGLPDEILGGIAPLVTIEDVHDAQPFQLRRR
jgi:hypothetical protein